MLQVKVLQSMLEVEEAQWDVLVGTGSPFLEWAWLSSMEEARCVGSRAGWQPQHLAVFEDNRLVAACPLYLKGNSMGEFVFDHSWADAAERAGISYYPKMLVAAPFTPATGIRFLTAPGADRPVLVRLLGQTLQEVCRQNELSSVHVNFCLDDETEILAELGYLKRVGLQYQWLNYGYRAFEDYLAHFRTKRRNQIKREMREMNDQGVEITALSGDAIPDELVPRMFALYKTHLDKLYWGRQYLQPRFFDLLGQRFKRNLCFVVAHQRGELVAGTFNVQKSGVMYGRYWGAFREVRHLHFNVCYYAAIRHCIQNGFARFEPGAGGDFKRLRGFDPQPTVSMHFFADERLAAAVARFLDREREQMHKTIDYLHEESELKHESPPEESDEE
ncbi:MAG: GNAT family N-acetyltransferase [Deltaproteobacteria bacterium]|nr:GNAT family N-acetyltransferase [Deltaproteobacteria bacterium]